jgi:hypothetical protein
MCHASMQEHTLLYRYLGNKVNEGFFWAHTKIRY